MAVPVHATRLHPQQIGWGLQTPWVGVPQALVPMETNFVIDSSYRAVSPPAVRSRISHRPMSPAELRPLPTAPATHADPKSPVRYISPTKPCSTLTTASTDTASSVYVVNQLQRPTPSRALEEPAASPPPHRTQSVMEIGRVSRAAAAKGEQPTSPTSMRRGASAVQVGCGYEVSSASVVRHPRQGAASMGALGGGDDAVTAPPLSKMMSSAPTLATVLDDPAPASGGRTHIDEISRSGSKSGFGIRSKLIVTPARGYVTVAGEPSTRTPTEGTSAVTTLDTLPEVCAQQGGDQNSPARHRDKDVHRDRVCVSASPPPALRTQRLGSPQASITHEPRIFYRPRQVDKDTDSPVSAATDSTAPSPTLARGGGPVDQRLESALRAGERRSTAPQITKLAFSSSEDASEGSLSPLMQKASSVAKFLHGLSHVGPPLKDSNGLSAGCVARRDLAQVVRRTSKDRNSIPTIRRVRSPAQETEAPVQVLVSESLSPKRRVHSISESQSPVRSPAASGVEGLDGSSATQKVLVSEALSPKRRVHSISQSQSPVRSPAASGVEGLDGNSATQKAPAAELQISKRSIRSSSESQSPVRSPTASGVEVAEDSSSKATQKAQASRAPSSAPKNYSSLTVLPTALPPELARFEQGEALGHGAFAVICRVRETETNKNFVLKVVEKHPLAIRRMLPQLYREAEVQSKIAPGSEHCVGAHETVESPTHMYLLLDYYPLGSLLKSVARGPLPEATVSIWTQQIAKGLQYLHENGVIHRDVKLDNLLLAEDGSVKLCDFGWCEYLKSSPQNMCGTPEFAAPEIHRGLVQTEKVDAWALGVCIGQLLQGKPGKFPELAPGSTWGAAEPLLTGLWKTDPAQRFGMPEVLAHPWPVATSSAVSIRAIPEEDS